MATVPFLTNIDLGKNQLENAALQSLTDSQMNAIVSPANGQVCLNTTNNKAYIYSTASPAGWKVVGVSVAAGTGMGTFTETAGVVTINAAQNIATTASPAFAFVTLNNEPTASSHAATKNYVDGMAQGVKWKTSVRAMYDGTTMPTIGEDGLLIFQGLNVAAGQRILFTNLTNAAENGIYIVGLEYPPPAGAHWIYLRSSDTDTWAEVPAATVMVEEGTYADTAYVCTSNVGGVLGTNAITFVKMSKAIGTVDLTTSVTGTLPVGNGGTGTATAPTAWGVVYAASTSAYANTAAGTSGYVLKSNGTSAPTWTADIPGNAGSASQIFLDAPTASPYSVIIGGSTASSNSPVYTSSLTYNPTGNGTLTIGGSGAGALVAASISGLTTALTVGQGGTGATTAAGARTNLGIVGTGNTGTGVAIATPWTGLVNKFTCLNANSTSTTVNHQLNTIDVHVQVWEVGGSKRMIMTEVDITDLNNIVVYHPANPAASTYRIVVMG